MRRRSMRNFLATMAFSQGVPMLAHGDEVARTQRGNNNAYAQDNEITWVDWSLEEWQSQLLSFARRVFAIRHSNPLLRRRHFFKHGDADGDGTKEVTWLRPDGSELGDGTGTTPATRCSHADRRRRDARPDDAPPGHGDTMLSC